MGNHRFVQPPMLLSVRMDVCLENYLNTYTCFQPFGLMSGFIIRKSKCSTDFKRNDFLKKTKRTHWVRFVHLNSLIESCVFLYLWNSPFDTFL